MWYGQKMKKKEGSYDGFQRPGGLLPLWAETYVGLQGILLGEQFFSGALSVAVPFPRLGHWLRWSHNEWLCTSEASLGLWSCLCPCLVQFPADCLGKRAGPNITVLLAGNNLPSVYPPLSHSSHPDFLCCLRELFCFVFSRSLKMDQEGPVFVGFGFPCYL